MIDLVTNKIVMNEISDTTKRYNFTYNCTMVVNMMVILNDQG
jgi:hypothetical protein